MTFSLSAVMLRIQLNILAGYLYEQEIACVPHLVNNNIQKGKFSSELQEKFLNICTYFVSEGTAYWLFLSVLNLEYL